MHVPVIVTLLDTTLGRVDYNALSTQTLMELLICDVEMKGRFLDDQDEYKDIDAWSDISFDEDGLLVDIWWSNALTISKGTMHLEWIPSTVRSFCAMRNDLHGTIETHRLPPSILFFNIMSNDFCGSFNIAGLPANIQKVTISWNSFSGALNIPALPQKVKTFQASVNQFSGTIDITKLPGKLEVLLIDTNRLSGSLGVMHMPPQMRSVGLNNNFFKQDVFHICHPSQVEAIFVDYRNSGIQKCIDENGVYVKSKQTLSMA